MSHMNWPTTQLLLNVDNDEGLYREAHRLARALWDAEDQDITPLAEAIEQWMWGTYSVAGHLETQDSNITLKDWYEHYGSVNEDVSDWNAVNWETVAMYYVNDIA